MVRHSHHHVPAHMAIGRYKPPCCGCGGINRQQLRRDNAKQKADMRAGMERLQNMQQLEKKEQIPQYVRDMAGIKIKQQLQADTITFAKVLQQKGVSKEKALEKLVDKLVSMYASEKELMKALKNMEISKLLELLKKALSTVNEADLGKDDDRKKVKDKGDITTNLEEAEEEEEDDDDDDDENKDEKNKKTKKKSKKQTKSNKKNNKDSFVRKSKRRYKDSIFDTDKEFVSYEEDDDENYNDNELEEEFDPYEIISEETTDEINQPDSDPRIAMDPTANIKVEIDETEVKFAGNSYSLSAINLLREQEDLEMNAIRREVLYNDKKNKTIDNPLTRDKAANTNSQETKKDKQKDNTNIKQLTELENENERLKKIILDLQNERRSKLIAGVSK